MSVVYERLCYNCGGPISSHRLRLGLPCKTCLEDIRLSTRELSDYRLRLEKVYRELIRRGNAQGIITIMEVEDEVKEFAEFFKRTTGHCLWSAQKAWARRLVLGESFAIIAPTGVGKTTLLVVYSIYTALNKGKVYFIVPTNTLVEQVHNMFKKYGEKNNIKILAYTSRLSKNKKQEIMDKIVRGDYQVLVTTANFLSRNYELLKNTRFKLVVVDDVDAILHNSKNIERVLELIGFSKEVIDEALKLVFLKIQAAKTRALGKNEDYQKILDEIAEISNRIHEYKIKNNIGQLVLASATGRARGLKVKLFKELLGFDIGGISEYMRNILDAYTILYDPVKQIVEIYRKLGPGGLVFVSKDLGARTVKILHKKLMENGIRCIKALSGSSFIEKIQRGEADLVVGVASYYGVMVRGLDEPEKIRYAVFLGIPKHVITLENALKSPWRIIQLALALMDRGVNIDKSMVNRLIQRISSLKTNELTALRIALANNEELKGRLGEILENLVALRKIVKEKIRELSNIDDIVTENFILKNDGRGIKIIIPDVMTYIQASGRTSRLYKGQMTFGLSIILVDDEKLLDIFVKKMRRYFPRFNITRLEDLDVPKLREKIIKSRQTNTNYNNAYTPVKTALLVVESPTKAKTIARLFGRPAKRRLGRLVVYEVPGYLKINNREYMYLFLITASYGHLTDLTMNNVGFHGVIADGGKYVPVYNTIKRCLKCGYQFTSDDEKCPRCGSSIINDSIDVIRALQRLAVEVDEVYIATDPDIEGEKIAWDIYNIVAAYVNEDNVYRLDIYEITRSGVEKAFEKPRKINNQLVKAQLVRRITDRWIGFTLSSHLWEVFGQKWLGAGRVQTPVLGWVIDRYNEWRKTRGYKLLLLLDNNVKLALFVQDKYKLEKILDQVITNGVRVESLELYAREISPPPPYTTDTLLRDASLKLGLTTSMAMKIAQQLFEIGLITYHRTDSVRVSNTGINVAKTYICNNMKECELFTPRSWSSEGAHEAIRPTRPIDAEGLLKGIVNGEITIPIPLTKLHIKLYDLIFRRFISSQMKPSRILYAKLRLNVENYGLVEIELPVKVLEKGHVIVLDKNLRLYNVESLSNGSVLKVKEYKVVRASPITLYTYGDLVWLMKTKKLGRPSTYAKILESIRRHGYVIESKKRKYLIPTSNGIRVYNYLTTHFPELVSEETTRRLEEILELVEKGYKDYVEVLHTTYNMITSLVAKVPTVSVVEVSGLEDT